VEGRKAVKRYRRGKSGKDEGDTPPPVFFVRVASKGLTRLFPVRVANTGVKVACFDVVRQCVVRGANKGDTASRGDGESARRFFEQPATRDIRDSTMRVIACQGLLYM
jgi:hypothetical protein